MLLSSRLRQFCALACMSASQTLAASAVIAQENRPIAIPNRESCSACVIKLTRVARLGNNFGASEPGSQGPLRTIVRDSRGIYYAAYGGGHGSQVFVHAPDGRVVRTLGRKGEGPGEFQTVAMLAIAPGDTLHAFDQMAGRWSVFAPDGHFVRATTLPAVPHSVVPLRGGAVLMNGTVRTPERIGLPIHLLDASGAIRLSFGREKAVRRPDLSLLDLRQIVRSGNDAFWLLYKNEYRLEKWDSAGHRLKTYVRSPSWFEPWLTPASMSPTQPPSSNPVGFAAATDDMVWTVTRIGAPDWHRGLRQMRSESGRLVYAADDLEVVYDSMIEYLDLRQGRVVARARSSMVLGHFVDREHVVGYSFDEDGRTYVSVWRVQLVQP